MTGITTTYNLFMFLRAIALKVPLDHLNIAGEKTSIFNMSPGRLFEDLTPEELCKQVTRSISSHEHELFAINKHVSQENANNGFLRVDPNSRSTTTPSYGLRKSRPTMESVICWKHWVTQ